ncbi:putative dehydrogenase [Arthrobacter sp. CAN_A6]|uniref:Gfo/Idh/MocA family protein n=1 Tax=Arthrobacter sp. CAN_A6 TaxID=2787721 RepID=UPI0018CA1674
MTTTPPGPATTPSPAPAPSPTHAPSRTLGVAVIGYSFMGRAHSNAWRNVNAFYESPRVEQRLLVGRDEHQLVPAAQRLGWAGTATDWRTVLERDDIDIVDICTPGHLHAEIAVAALEAGKHVLVEKPLANSVAEAETMVAAATAARARGIQSMVGFNYRRLPSLALARDLLAAGRVGEVRQVRVSYLQDWLADENAPMSWRLRRETAGSGALGDLASHAVDQIQFLLGTTVTSISGTVNTFVPERPGAAGLEAVTVDDAAWATLHLASGAVASLEVSRFATGRRNALQIEVYGSLGSLRFDLERLNELQYFDATAPAELQGSSRILVTEETHPYLHAWWPTGHTLGWDHTFTTQAADFLTAIASGTAPRPSFEDALDVQRVLSALEDSARAGSAVVELDQPS